MHRLKVGFKPNKTTYIMLKWLEGLKSYEFLSDFVFTTCHEIWVRGKWWYVHQIWTDFYK